MSAAEVEFRLDRHEVGKVQVRATRDFWVIPDCVAGRAGVYNDALRPADELERSWATLEGKPIIIHHPPDDEVHHGLLAVFPDEIHGIVRNVRWHAADQSIRYDAHLFRRVDVPGHQTLQSIVDTNEQIVTALMDGVPIDNSPGYMTRVQRVRGELDGRPYSEIRRDFGYWHLAIVPVGACGWDDHCGLGRGQDKTNGEPPMPKPDQDKPKTVEDLQAEIDQLKACAKKADERDAELRQQMAADRKKLEDQLAALTRRGDNRQDPPADPKPSPELQSIKQALDKLEEAQKRADEERKREQDTRLAKKRDELAKLRGLKGDAAKALDAYTEPALDDAIQRERELRARADGLTFLPEAEGDGSGTAGGLTGPTVGRWDAAKGDFVTS